MITENYQSNKLNNPTLTYAPSVFLAPLSTDDTPHTGDWPGYTEWRGEVYQALKDAAMDNEAEAFWSCAGGDPVVWAKKAPAPDAHKNVKSNYVCGECCQVKLIKETCHLRICPDCARRASARFIERFMPVAEYLIPKMSGAMRFRKIVLTTPFSLTDDDVDSQYRRLKKLVPKVFDELLPDGWRRYQGFIVADEFGAKGKKLHFHILFFGQYIDQSKQGGFKLSRAWNKVTGGSCKVAYIKQVKPNDVRGEILETLKYTTKFWKRGVDGDIERLEPSLVPTLASVLKGSRRVRSYGVFYRVPQPDRRPVTCPDCNIEMIRLSQVEYEIYFETGWLPEDAELYLRIGNKSPGRGVVGANAPPGLPLRLPDKKSKPVQSPIPGWQLQSDTTYSQ